MANRSKLFVGNLPADTTESALRAVFEPFGEVKEVHIMSSARSRLGYACAFVVYAPSAQADVAVDALNGLFKLQPTDSEPISVSYARQEESKKARQAQDQWGGQQDWWSGGGYQQYYAMQALMQAQYASALGYPAFPGMDGGAYPSAFGDFGKGADFGAYGADAAASAIAGMAALQGMQAQAGMGNPFGGGGGGGQATQQADESKLFIGGLPAGVTEGEIRTVFSQVGTVKEVHIMQGKSQSGQACAFLLYPDAYSAQLAIRTLNKTPWHSAPDAPPIIVRTADKVQKKKGGAAKEVNPAMLRGRQDD
jgi:RNA recognition motif-containing protein